MVFAAVVQQQRSARRERELGSANSLGLEREVEELNAKIVELHSSLRKSETDRINLKLAN